MAYLRFALLGFFVFTLSLNTALLSRAFLVYHNLVNTSEILLTRADQSVIQVRLWSGLSLLARISLAKYRKNVEQKWHCVQPLDHWMLVRASPIRRINTTLRMYQHGWFSVSARCECTLAAQTRGVLLRRFAVERDAHVSRVSMPSWEPLRPFRMILGSIHITLFSIYCLIFIERMR